MDEHEQSGSIYDTLIENPFRAAEKAKGQAEQPQRPTAPVTTSRIPPPDIHSVARWGKLAGGRCVKLELQLHGGEESISAEVSSYSMIGRHMTKDGRKPDIALDTFDAQQKGVSREHAALVLAEEDALKIVDLNSTNGTFLNGHRLAAGQARILRDGDRLRLGSLELTVVFG